MQKPPPRPSPVPVPFSSSSDDESVDTQQVCAVNVSCYSVLPNQLHIYSADNASVWRFKVMCSLPQKESLEERRQLVEMQEKAYQESLRFDQAKVS